MTNKLLIIIILILLAMLDVSYRIELNSYNLTTNLEEMSSKIKLSDTKCFDYHLSVTGDLYDISSYGKLNVVRR